MKTISRIALGISLALASGSVAFAPAVAKKSEAQQMNLSPDVVPDLQAAQEALGKKDFATVQAKVTAAEAKAKTPDDHFQIGIMKFNLGNQTQNTQLQAEGADEAIASGRATPDQAKQLYNIEGVMAYNSHNMAKAEAAFTKLVELDPTNADNINLLVETKIQNHKLGEALALVNKAIDAKKAAGQPVPETLYQRGLAIADDPSARAMIQPASVDDMAIGLVTAYPTPDNWRSALTVFRDIHKLDPSANLDVMRLARAAHALKGESDYNEYQQGALNRGLPGEAKSLIDEGGASHAIDTSKPVFRDARTSEAQIAKDKASLPASEKQARAAPTGKYAATTADAYFSYGQYPQAVALYRVALQKGGVDAAEVNTHLGIALAKAGDKAGAQQAFAQVTGPRAAIAKLWTVWLNQGG